MDFKEFKTNKEEEFKTKNYGVLNSLLNIKENKKNIKQDINEDLDIEYNKSEEIVEQLFDGYLGEKNFDPNPLEYGPNATYRRAGTVYKKSVDNLWEVYLQDGKQGPKGSAGGSGVGVQEVKQIATDISKIIVTSAISSISLSAFSDNNKVYVSNFGAIGNGIANDYLAISAAISSCPENGTVVFDSNKIYNVSGIFNVNKSLKIEGNNSTIKSNNRLIVFKNLKSQYTVGNYFNVSAGDNYFISPSISFLDNEIVRFESNDRRLVSSTYYHGQMCRITSISGNKYFIESPIMESFNVDRIYIYNNNINIINDLNFDFTSTTRLPSENIYHVLAAGNYYTEFNNCRIFGGRGSGVGFFIQSYIVRMNNCVVDSIEDIPINTTSADLILGYGYSLIGDDLEMNGCYGYNCKHIIDSEDRYCLTRKFKINGGSFINPSNRYDETITIGSMSGVPTKQYCIGSHANVKTFVVDGVYADGCNDVIGIRCGNMTLTNSTIVGRECLPVQENIVRLVEGTVNSVLISNCQVIVPDNIITSGVRHFVGIHDIEGQNENFVLDNVTFSGGKILSLYEGDYSGINFKNVIVKNVYGEVYGGLQMVGTIDNIILENINLKMNTSTGNTKSFFYLYVSDVKNVIIRNNNLDYSTQNTTSRLVLLYDCTIENIQIDNNIVKCGYTAFEYRQVNHLAPSTLNITNNIVYCNMGTSSSAYFPGINLEIFTQDAGKYSISNNTISVVNSAFAANNNPIRITSAGDSFLLTNNQLNRDWFLNTYPNIIPIGNVNVSGTLSWKGSTKIDTKGEMTKSTSATTGTFYVGERIYNSALTSAGPLGWVCVTSGTPGTWVNLNI